MHNNNSGIFGILAIGGCAALFLLARKFFPSLAAALLYIAGAAILVILILIGLVIYFSVTDAKKNNDPSSPQAILSKARSELTELRRKQVKLKNRDVYTVCREIIDIIEKILSVLKQKPQSIHDARQFLNYYLPTLSKILTSYIRIEESGALTAELTDSTIAHLGEIRNAMNKQYSSLFEEDVLDLSVDMEALTLACKRDGLLGDDSSSDV